MTTHEPARPVRPFQTLADPELHLENPFHGRILGRLLSTIQSAEPLAVLTGEPGTGKTTILRRLMTQLELRGFRSVIHRVPLGLDDLQATLSTVNHERRAVVGLDEAQRRSWRGHRAPRTSRREARPRSRFKARLKSYPGHTTASARPRHGRRRA